MMGKNQRSMTKELSEQYYNIYTDSWKFFRKYIISNLDGEQLLKEMHSEIVQMSRKYDNPLCNQLLIAAYDEIGKLHGLDSAADNAT